MMSEENKSISKEQKTEARRDFIKKAAYIAPAVITMSAVPAFAVAGSTVPVKPAP